jgi:prepilin-type N-terminal cleavage/methylation domain-containing protein
MKRKGFTLIELLVVIVIIGILVAIALPNFIKIKDKAKEAEVKQNLHAIQLAVERYAVDSEGSVYPLCIMGGDWTDTDVVWQEWVDDQNITWDNVNPQRKDQWQAAPPWRGDPLVMESYLPSYPQNPFNKQGGQSLLPQITHNPGGVFGAPWTRIVGGRESNKMYEVFGPEYFFPSNYSIPNGDLFVHHIFDDPKYDTMGDVEKTPLGQFPWRSPSGNQVLTGNFSWFPRNSLPSGFPWNVGAGTVQGYTLAGYGAMRTGGQDVYNRNGNYRGRFRTTNCELNCIGQSLGYGEIPCLCGSSDPPSILKNDGGSDTIIDGVVVTLDSGVDKKSEAVNPNQTEGT